MRGRLRTECRANKTTKLRFEGMLQCGTAANRLAEELERDPVWLGRECFGGTCFRHACSKGLCAVCFFGQERPFVLAST